MPATAEKDNPALWKQVKQKVTKGDKGGKPGQWSARKAQLAIHDYKAEGGTYRGKKSGDNHLSQWTKEEWGTKSGRESAESGERYLPRAARDSLSDDEYRATTRKKRMDTEAGRQVSRQPKAIAKKVAAARRRTTIGQATIGQTRMGLLEEARRRGLKNVSRLRKAELAKAFGA